MHLPKQQIPRRRDVLRTRVPLKLMSEIGHERAAANAVIKGCELTLGSKGNRVRPSISSQIYPCIVLPLKLMSEIGHERAAANAVIKGCELTLGSKGNRVRPSISSQIYPCIVLPL